MFLLFVRINSKICNHMILFSFHANRHAMRTLNRRKKKKMENHSSIGLKWTGRDKNKT